jgi:quinolinate synthase
VRKIADFIGGTGDLRRYAQHVKSTEFIVGTEDGIIHALEKENPQKTFYPVNTICDGMKKINMEKVILSLERTKYRVRVPADIRDKARIALMNMLNIRKTENHDN